MRNNFLPDFYLSDYTLGTDIQISKFKKVRNNHWKTLHVIFLSPKKVTPSDGTTRENIPQNICERENHKTV